MIFSFILQPTRHCFIIALLFCGLPIIWVIRDIQGFEGVTLAWLFMATILALLPKYGTIVFQRKLYTPSINIFPASLFLLLSFVFSIAHGDWVGSIYILFVIIVALGMLTVPSVKYEHLPTAFLIVAIVSSIVVLYYAVSRDLWLETGRLLITREFNPNYLSFIGGLGILVGVFLLSKQKHRLLSIIGITLGMIIVLRTMTRSTIVSLTLCGLTWLMVMPSGIRTRLQKISFKPKGTLFSLFLLILTIGLVNFIFQDIFKTSILTYRDFTISGITTYIYGTEEDMAAQIRYDLIRVAIEQFKERPIFGNGYKALYVDFPILQSFHDLGVGVGILFIIATVILPIAYIWRIIGKSVPDYQKLSSYLYIFFLPNLISHGQPYDFMVWMPIALLIGVSRKHGFHQ